MKQQKTTAAHFVLTVIGTILCIVLIPILFINCTLIVKSYLNQDEVPSFGSFVPMIVLTDSMYPAIQSGDLILCRQTAAEQVQVGDVICFFDPAGSGSSTVTHRVVRITTDEAGGLAWVTRGDANNADDPAPVPAQKLVGVYTARIAGAGNAAMFMQTTQGLILCVICPIILLVAYDIFRRRSYEKSRQADTQALLVELEALRAEREKNARA